MKKAILAVLVLVSFAACQKTIFDFAGAEKDADSPEYKAEPRAIVPAK